MKIKSKSVSAATSLLLLACVLSTPIDADAKSIFRKIKKVGDSAVKSTSSAVTQTAGAVATTTTSTVTATASTVAHAADTVAATSSSELNAVGTLAKQTYAASAQEVTNGYNKAVAELNAALNAALLAAYKQVGNAMLSANRDKVTRLASTFRNLDDEGLAALNRIVDAVASQQINNNLYNDMQVLGRKLNLQNGMGQVGSNVPNAVSNSNFGVQVDTTMGLGLGWGQSYAIAMNVVPSNGHYRMAFLQAKSVSVGLQADDSVGVSLFWSPGSVDDSNGNSVGLALELAADGGAAVGMSWPAVTSIKDLSRISPVPGIGLALVGGDSVKVDLVAGYTKVIKGFQLP